MEVVKQVTACRIGKAAWTDGHGLPRGIQSVSPTLQDSLYVSGRA
jgi:hypothetical protein